MSLWTGALGTRFGCSACTHPTAARFESAVSLRWPAASDACVARLWRCGDGFGGGGHLGDDDDDDEGDDSDAELNVKPTC